MEMGACKVNGHWSIKVTAQTYCIYFLCPTIISIGFGNATNGAHLPVNLLMSEICSSPASARN